MKILSNSTILVTGGNGAVGANLVNKLLSFGSKVTVLDDFSQSIPSNLKPRKNLHVVNGDINDIKLIKKIFTKKFDYVFHLAARFANELSTLNPIEDLHVNIQGTLQLLIESAKQNPKRFLYTSSSSLFGVQEKLPLDEDSLPNPSTPYAVSKLTGEYYCKVFQKMYNLKYSVVRLSNSYGPIDPNNKPSSLASAAIFIVNPSIFSFLFIAISRFSLAAFLSSSFFSSNSFKFSSVAYLALAFGIK